jgi:hypothetical protein
MFDRQLLEGIRNRISLKGLASYLGIQIKIKDNQCWFVCPRCAKMKASFQKNHNLARCWKCNIRYNPIELVMAHCNMNFKEAVMFLIEQERQLPKRDTP